MLKENRELIRSAEEDPRISEVRVFGSFTTKKVKPSDIDLALFVDPKYLKEVADDYVSGGDYLPGFAYHKKIGTLDVLVIPDNKVGRMGFKGLTKNHSPVLKRQRGLTADEFLERLRTESFDGKTEELQRILDRMSPDEVRKVRKEVQSNESSSA